MKTIISLILAENRTPGIVDNFKEIWNTFNCGMSGTCQTMPPKMETLISLGKAGKLSITVTGTCLPCLERRLKICRLISSNFKPH